MIEVQLKNISKTIKGATILEDVNLLFQSGQKKRLRKDHADENHLRADAADRRRGGH